MPSISELLARHRARLPGKTEQFLQRAAKRGTSILELIAPRERDPDVSMALAAKFGIPLSQFTAPPEEIKVPPPVTRGEKVSQFAGSVAPDTLLGVLTAPIAAATTARSAAGGAGLLRSLLAGEIAQSAALAPIEFGTRPPGEAAIITAAAPIAGTTLGAGFRGLGRLVKGAGDVPPPRPEPPPPVNPITQAVREAQAQQDALATELTPRIKTAQGEFTPRPPPPAPPPPPEPGAIARAVREAQARQDELAATIASPLREAGEFAPRLTIRRPPPLPEPEEIVPLAPAKTETGEIRAGTPEAASQKEALKGKVTRIRATAEAEVAAAQRKWPGWTPQKETLFESLTTTGVSQAQAKHLLSDPAMASRLAGNFRASGREDLASALEATVGPPKPTPEGLSLQDALAQSLDALGPAATRVMDEAVDEMPPGLAKRFLDNNEAGFIRLGRPMTWGNLFDRILYARSAGLISGISTVLGNITSNAISLAGQVPQRVLAAPISRAGRLVFGRGPTAQVAEAGYQALGYMQGIANLIQGMRKRQALGYVKSDIVRFAEASRTVRVLQEGADPFAEAGTIGTVVGAGARAAYKWGLEIPDRLMWDPAFTGHALTWAHRKAVASGAKNVPKEMRRLLDEANAQAVSATSQAKSFVRRGGRTIARKRAAVEGAKGIKAAEAQISLARAGGRGLPEARDALRLAQENANSLMRTAELNPAEVEFLERSIMRELPMDAVSGDVATLRSLMDEARFLTERAMFMARENKKLDAAVSWIQQIPALDRVRKFILPFLRTPANVAREAVRTSPIGFATAFPKLLEAGGYRNLRAAGVPMDQALAQTMKNVDDAGLMKLYDDLAQATYGTAIMYGTYAALDHGIIRVVPYTPGMKKEERLALEAQGIPTDSIVIGNWAIPLHRIEPVGRAIRAADRLLRLNAEKPNDEILNSARALAQEYVVSTSDDVWLSGMQQLMEATTDDKSLAAYANKAAGTFVPRIAQSIAQVVRGERVSRRPTEGILKEALKGPVQALSLGKPDLGLFGRPRTTTALHGLTGFSLRADDPLLQELTAVDYFPATRLPQIDLSEGESQDATQTKGFIQEQALKALIAQPAYQGLETPELKKRALERTIDRVGARVGKVIRARKKAGMSLSYADLLQVLSR